MRDELVELLRPIPAEAHDAPPVAKAVVGKGGMSMKGEDGSSLESDTAFATCATDTAFATLVGEGLAAWDADPDFARFMVERAGLTFEPNREQCWRIDGSELTVKVWRDDERGFYVLRLLSGWPAGLFRRGAEQGPRSLALGEVYAIAVSSVLHSVGEPALARWKRRALGEAGRIVVPPVELAPLPEHATTEAVLTRGVIADLLAVRRLTDPPGEPVPLSSPFLVKWSGGQPEPLIRRGKLWLANHGFLTRVGTAPGNPKPTILWAILGDEAKQDDAA